MGETLHTLEGHTDAVSACAFSSDGSFIISASKDASLRMWDTGSGRLLRTLNPGDQVVLAFSPDARTIVFANPSYMREGIVTLRSVDSCQVLRTLESESHTEAVNACMFSPDGRYIVSASADETLRMWDAASGLRQRTLKGHRSGIWACAFSPDGHLVISASSYGLQMWDAASGRCLKDLSGHTGRVTSCVFSPDGRYIASASEDKTLRVWDTSAALSSGAAGGRALRTLEGHTDGVTACAFSPDGLFIVSASKDGTGIVWEAAGGQRLYGLKGHTKSVNTCAFSPDGLTIVSAGEDKTLRVWDAAAGQPLRTLRGHTNTVTECVFSPDGRFIVSTGRDKTLRVWDPGKGDMLTCIPLPSALNSVGLHPIAPQMVCGGVGGVVTQLYLVGIEYGPIIITTKARKQWIKHELFMRCPACQQEHPVEEKQLGSDLTCPTPGCGIRIRLNPFTIQPSGKTGSMLG